MSLSDMLDIGGFGLGLAGAVSGARSDRKARQLTREQMAQAQGQFNQQMDQSIFRRVADAKRSGIHPLFAMGASVGASPTMLAGGPSGDTGKAGRALSRAGESLQDINMKRAAAERDEAQAQLFLSQKAQLDQALNSEGRDTPGVMGPPEAVTSQKPVPGPAVYAAPVIPFEKPGSPGHQAGTHSLWVDVKTEDGNTVSMLNPDLNTDEITSPNVWLALGGWLKNQSVDGVMNVHNFISRTVGLDRRLRMEAERLERMRKNPEKYAEAERQFRQWGKKALAYFKKAQELLK